VFVECDGDSDGAEEEANRFASTFLIPQSAYRRISRNVPRSAEEVKSIADELGIASGIVVGRLQHDGKIPMNRFNELKRRVDWERV